MRKTTFILVGVLLLLLMIVPSAVPEVLGRGSNNQTAINGTEESPLVADFSFSVCPFCSLSTHISVTFTNKSAGGMGHYKFEWDFGDGGTSHQKNPSHYYGGTGNYTVTLTVTDRVHNVATTSQTITVEPGPSSAVSGGNFSPTATTGTWPRCISGCTANDVEIYSVSLDIPAGNYTIGETVTGTVMMNLKFHRQNTYCIVVVADLYQGGNLKQANWISTIIGNHGGDGTQTYSMGTVSWTYGQLFEMRNVLVEWSQNSPDGGVCPTDCSEYGSPSKCSQVASIIVLTPLVADFDSNNVCYCNNTVFTDETTGGDTPYVSWFWNFGDGYNSTAQNPTHHYASSGTFTVTLTVTDSTDTTDSQSHNVTVYPTPAVNLSGDTSFCAGSNTTITADVTGGTSPYEYDWSASTAPGTPNDGTYTATGAGNVTVIVTDAHGCTDRHSVKVAALPAPVADFHASNNVTCAKTAINFFDDSTGTYDTWLWDFGDGTTSTLENPSHTYTVAGTYTVSLTIGNGCGDDTKTKIDYITVGAPPIANFSADQTSGCAPLTVVFTDLSTGNITSWSWIFGDGGTSSLENPSHTYTTPGTYTVSLTVANRCGEDTKTMSITAINCAPIPPAGPTSCPTTRYLTVDWEGKNTTKPLYSNGRLAVDLEGPSPDFADNLFLERGTHAPIVSGTTYYLIVVDQLEQYPTLPENTEAVVVYNVTPTGAVFDRNIVLTLGLTTAQLPATGNVTMDYYDDINHVWVPLNYEAGGPNEFADVTLSAPINHFSIYGVLTQVPTTPTQSAHFVASGLDIVTSIQKIWAPVTFVTDSGKTVTITANVANDGYQQGAFNATLTLNGQTVDTKTITLGAGQSTQVTFIRSGLAYGQYDVQVAGLNGQFATSRTITWWLIAVIIVALGLIIWGVVWGRRRRRAH